MKAIFQLFLFLLCTCTIHSQSLYFPPVGSDEWETVSPSDLGWNLEALDSLNMILENGNSKAFMVLIDGKIAIEEYYNDFHADSFWYWASAGKGLTAFLTGIAQSEGQLDIENSTSDYLGLGWTSADSTQEAQIRIVDQLQMTTGLDETIDNQCTLDSCLQYLADPGSRWSYHNAPYTLIGDVLQAATGSGLNGLLLTNLRFTTGIQGAYLPLGFNQIMFSSPRSMARFGLLMLNEGSWKGQGILGDTEYFHQMINPSQSLNESYGYLWWLNGKGSYMLPQSQIVFNGPIIPHAPSDMYAALGLNGQLINVVPSLNLVMIRMGDNPELGPVPTVFNDDIWKQLNKVFGTTHTEEIAEKMTMEVITNPTQGPFQLGGISSSTAFQYQIHSSEGQLIERGQNRKHFDLSDQPPGVYYMSVIMGNHNTSFKIIVTP